ncbi:MAG: hypothetical protein II943_00590 [Victivallales bacterium]|nr:hypothetical protein [Victivallales bacterium]
MSRLPIHLFLLAAITIFAAEKPLYLRSEGTAEEYAIRAYTPPPETLAGDTMKNIPLTIELTFPVDANFSGHDLKNDSLMAFELINGASLPETIPGEDDKIQTLRFHYELEPLQPPYDLPAVSAVFHDAEGNEITVATSPFSLELSIPEPNLPPTLENDAEYLTPASSPIFDYKKLWKRLAWIGGGILFAILVIASIWRTLRHRRNVYAVVLSPFEIADHDLNELLAEKLPEAGKYKHFYQRISDIMREYLENRFALHAPRLTTEEFLRQLTATPTLIREHRELLQKFLTACDMVKFASQVPATPEILEITQACRNFLDTTNPTPHASANVQSQATMKASMDRVPAPPSIPLPPNR